MRRELIADKSFSYAGKRLTPGSEFSAQENDARLLVAIKNAHYKTRVMTNYQTKVKPPKPPERAVEPQRRSEFVPRIESERKPKPE